MLIVPACLSLLAVWNENAIAQWVKERDSFLLVAVFAILAALLHPRLQRLLIVTLSYGVAFLALRDIYHLLDLPEPLSRTPIAAPRAILLGLIALLAIVGAIFEALKAGTLTARRIYTGAAALFFIEQGALYLYWQASWQAIVLLTTGVLCGLGCLFAPYIMLSQEPQPVQLPQGESEEREILRQKLVQLCEWNDPDTEETTISVLPKSEGEEWGQAEASLS
jgi:hypothetical protein